MAAPNRPVTESRRLKPRSYCVPRNRAVRRRTYVAVRHRTSTCVNVRRTLKMLNYMNRWCQWAQLRRQRKATCRINRARLMLLPFTATRIVCERCRRNQRARLHRRRTAPYVNGSGPLSQRSAIANVQGGLDWIQTIFFF